MARELNVQRLLATTFVALTVALSVASTTCSTTTMAVAKPSRKKGASGGGDDDGQPSRIPGTLPSGAPIRMPELEGLSVVLPFSLRRSMGLTNITDIVQSYSAGAFCDATEIASGRCDGVSGAAEAATRSRLSFHQQPESEDSASSAGDDTANGYITLEHVMDATDETFLLFFYDSLDGNSYRNAAMVDEAAGMLKGYVTTVGIDIRRDDLQWALSAWNIQLAPSLRLLRPTRMMSTTRQALTTTDAITGTVGSTGSHLINNLNAALSPSYSLYAGAKGLIDIAPSGDQMVMMRQSAWAPEAIKKFALGGGKSLDSENTIETLTQGDKAAETVYDVIRGAHPLTYTSKSLLGTAGGAKKASSFVPAGADAFTEGVLTSPLYTRRAQVPKAVIIMFTDKDGAMGNLFKAVALRYNNRAVCITVNGKDRAPQLAKAFGVTSYPTFAVVKPPQSEFDHVAMKEQLVSGAFSKKRKGDKTVFDLIAETLSTDAATGNLRLYAPEEGSTVNINTIMAFMDEKAPSASSSAVSLSGIVPATTLYALQREASRDAFHYQQVRAQRFITPIATAKDWDHLVYMHAGVVASGPAVTNPKKAPMITVGVLFTPDANGGEVSDVIRQEVGDVKNRLKDNYFVSIPKSKAMETLKYFRQKCVMEGEAASAEEISATTTDVVFLYAKLLPLHASAAPTGAAAAALAPNFIIDYSCKTPASAEESSSLLSSAMRIDKAVHYGAKKGFVGFGGSEQPAPSFDWSEVPAPKL